MYLHKLNPHGVLLLGRGSRVASTSLRPKCRLVRLLGKYRKYCFYGPLILALLVGVRGGFYDPIPASGPAYRRHQFFLEREWSACAKRHGMMTPWQQAWSSWCTTVMPAMCSDTCFYDFHKFNIHLFALALVFDRWRWELVHERLLILLGWCRLQQRCPPSTYQSSLYRLGSCMNLEFSFRFWFDIYTLRWSIYQVPPRLKPKIEP